MLAQQPRTQPLETGGRLPPTPAPGQTPARPLFPGAQAGHGNAAVQEMLQRAARPSGPMPGGSGGQMGALRTEPIGESTDETVIGGELPFFESGDEDFLYGRIGLDDAAIKGEFGLLRPAPGDSGFSLVNGDGHAGFWWDEDDNWNLGLGGQLGLAEFHDSWRAPAHLGSLEASLDVGLGQVYAHTRYGADGLDGDLGYDGLAAQLAVGTGENADSSNDFTFTGSAGLGVGADWGLDFTDVDGDGVTELGFHGGLSALGGIGVGVSSEAAGGIYDGACDLASDAWGALWGGE